MVWGEISICLCFQLFTLASQSSEKQQMLNVATKICPYTRFCHTNATRILEDAQKQDDLCCVPCSCDTDCWKTASCCIDKDGIDDKLPPLNCKETLVKKRNKEEVFQGFHGVRRYYIVDFCPEGQNGSAVDKKCRSKQAKMLEELVWVSDKDSGIIYQNQYCAECHGVNSFVQWQIKTDCLALLHTNFSSLFSDFSHHNCTLNNKSPESIRHIADQYRCYIPSFNKCNETGLWRNFNSDISSACDKLYSPVFQLRHVGYVLYKNVFCYICNGGSMADFDAFCPRRDEPGRTANVEFSALINFNKYTEVHAKDYDQNENQCRVDEVFDIYVKQCRMLVCPLGTTAVYGRCEQVLTETDGLPVAIVYSLTPYSVSNISILVANQDKSKALGRNIIKSFRASSGWRRSKCPFCDINVHQTTPTDDEMPYVVTFYFVISLYTDTRCQLIDIFETANAFADRNWTISITDTHYLTLKSEYSAVAIDSLPPDLIASFVRKIKCVPYLRAPFRQLCPAIDLNYIEIVSLDESKTKSFLLALFKAKQQSYGVLRICLDEYYSIISLKNSAAALNLYVGTLLFFLFSI